MARLATTESRQREETKVIQNHRPPATAAQSAVAKKNGSGSRCEVRVSAEFLVPRTPDPRLSRAHRPGAEKLPSADLAFAVSLYRLPVEVIWCSSPSYMLYV